VRGRPGRRTLIQKRRTFIAWGVFKSKAGEGNSNRGYRIYIRWAREREEVKQGLGVGRMKRDQIEKN